jgi:hypothetical protein
VNCKMQYLGTPFCAVCREQFIRVTHNLISTIDDYAPKTLSSIDDIITFDLSLVAPEPNTLKTSWFLNGRHIASNVNTLEINKSTLEAGANVLRANVYDSTTYDRRTTIYVNSVVWDISNDVASDWSKTEEDRREYLEEVLASATAREERLMWRIFPNPTSDTLKIAYDLHHAGNIQLSLMNAAGQLIESTSVKRQKGEYQHEMDLCSYDEGIYFLTFEANDFKQTVKVLKGK